MSRLVIAPLRKIPLHNPKLNDISEARAGWRVEPPEIVTANLNGCLNRVLNAPLEITLPRKRKRKRKKKNPAVILNETSPCFPARFVFKRGIKGPEDCYAEGGERVRSRRHRYPCKEHHHYRAELDSRINVKWNLMNVHWRSHDFKLNQVCKSQVRREKIVYPVSSVSFPGCFF